MNRSDIYREVMADPRAAWDRHAPAGVPICLDHVPTNLHVGIVAYGLIGVPVGGFLTATLENDFLEAIFRADLHSQTAIYPIALAVSALPRECRGSPGAVNRWIERGGLMQIRETEEMAP